MLLRGIMQGFARAYDMLVPDDYKSEAFQTGDQVSKNLFLPIHYRNLKKLVNDEAASRGGVGIRVEGTQMVTLPRSLLLPRNLWEIGAVLDGQDADKKDAKSSIWTVCVIRG